MYALEPEDFNCMAAFGEVAKHQSTTTQVEFMTTSAGRLIAKCRALNTLLLQAVH